MTTLAIMKARIADEYIDEAVTAAQIEKAILTSIKHYERRPFYFNQKTGTFSTVASQEYYSSSDLSDIPNIVSIVSALVTDSTKRKLQPVDFAVMDESQDGSVTGAPDMLAVFKQQIRLYPIPDSVYTITMAYVYRFDTLTDSDSNAWMTDGEELIRQRAKRTVVMDYLGGTDAENLIAAAAALEQEALDEILAEGRRRLPNTILRPEPMIQFGGAFNYTRGW